MKLSCKSIYAIRALFDLAYHGTGAPIKIEEIARRENISPRFLEQIFKDLKKADLISSKRGPKGGYFLAKRPDQISLGEIIRLLEGSLDEGSAKEKERLEEFPSIKVTQAALHELATQRTARGTARGPARWTARGPARWTARGTTRGTAWGTARRGGTGLGAKDP